MRGGRGKCRRAHPCHKGDFNTPGYSRMKKRLKKERKKESIPSASILVRVMPTNSRKNANRMRPTFLGMSACSKARAPKLYGCFKADINVCSYSS